MGLDDILILIQGAVNLANTLNREKREATAAELEAIGIARHQAMDAARESLARREQAEREAGDGS